MSKFVCWCCEKGFNCVNCFVGHVVACQADAVDAASETEQALAVLRQALGFIAAKGQADEFTREQARLLASYRAEAAGE